MKWEQLRLNDSQFRLVDAWRVHLVSPWGYMREVDDWYYPGSHAQSAAEVVAMARAEAGDDMDVREVWAGRED